MANATYALKGPVRTFRTEVATFVAGDSGPVEGPRVVQMEASFNEDGNRTDLHIYNNKGVLVRRIVMKFEGRKQIESFNYDGAGRMWLRLVNAYDDQGRPNGYTTYHGDGSLRSTFVVKRNQRGLVIESTETDSKGVLMEQVHTRYDGPKFLGRERKLFYPDGSLRSLEVYSEPKRLETTNFRPDGSILNKSFREDWDIAQYGADGSPQKITAISSDHRLLDSVIIDKNEPKQREAEIPDQLDAQGNWTKKTLWRTDEKGTKPVKVTYRTLTYY
jgi:hypothetical protein